MVESNSANRAAARNGPRPCLASYQIRVITGATLWLVGFSIACWWFVGRGPDSAIQPSLGNELYRFVAERRRVVDAQPDADCMPQLRDPVFVSDTPGLFRQIGEVSSIPSRETGRRAQIVFYATAPEIDADMTLTYHEPSDSLEWVIRTLLTPSKRKELADELNRAFAQHQEYVVAVLRPVVEESLREAFELLKKDVPRAIQNRRPELIKLGQKYEAEIVQKELIPVLQDEVWPIVRELGEPVVEDLGRDLWQRVSLWRFGWRYAYDQMPLPERKLTQSEWKRFVDKQVIPAFKDHSDEFAEVQKEIFIRVTKNDKVRAAVQRSIAKVVDDGDLHQFVLDLLQEVIIKNSRLHAIFEKHWKSEKTAKALRLASERIQPTAVRIGALLLGTPEGGVTPEFARILRHQILRKDRRWLVLHASESAHSNASSDRFVLPMSRGSAYVANPFLQQEMDQSKP